MQRIEIKEGELISGGHMVLSHAADGVTVFYALTEIWDTREEAYKLAKAERNRLIANRVAISEN